MSNLHLSSAVKSVFASLLTIGLLLSLQANAQSKINASSWPTQPIRIIVTFTPGGAPDILARVLAQSWQESLGVPVLVENRPGFGGNIGADMVAKSDPDGYTLLIGTVGIHAINGALYEKMSYDPIKDFTPISFLASTPNVLIVNKHLGVNNLHELIELAKAKPNQLTFGSSGVGTSLHMSGELFKEIKAGEVQALGVTTLKRSLAAPDIPTLAEQGLHGFEATSWFSLMAPANLPNLVQKRLNALTRQTLNNPQIHNRLLEGGLEPAPSSPKELAKLIQSEANKWSRVVHQSGAKVE